MNYRVLRFLILWYWIELINLYLFLIPTLILACLLFVFLWGTDKNFNPFFEPLHTIIVDLFWCFLSFCVYLSIISWTISFFILFKFEFPAALLCLLSLEIVLFHSILFNWFCTTSCFMTWVGVKRLSVLDLI